MLTTGSGQSARILAMRSAAESSPKCGTREIFPPPPIAMLIAHLPGPAPAACAGDASPKNATKTESNGPRSVDTVFPPSYRVGQTLRDACSGASSQFLRSFRSPDRLRETPATLHKSRAADRGRFVVFLWSLGDRRCPLFGLPGGSLGLRAALNFTAQLSDRTEESLQLHNSGAFARAASKTDRR